MEQCFSCSVATSYIDNASDSLSGLLTVLQDPLTQIFIAIASIWVVAQGVRLYLGRADMDDLTEKFFFVLVGFGALQGMNEGVVEQIFQTSVNAMFGVSSEIIGNNYNQDPASSAANLIGAVETAFQVPINMAQALISSASWTQVFAALVFAAALIVPFVMMLILYVKYCAVGLFRITLVCLFLPFIIVMSAFPFGRTTWQSAVSAVLESILTLMSVTLIFALVIKAIQGPLDSTTQFSAQEILNDQLGHYVMAVVLAWCGWFLIMEGQLFAKALSGRAFSIISNATGARQVVRHGGPVMGAAAGAAGSLFGKLGSTVKDLAQATQNRDSAQFTQRKDAIMRAPANRGKTLAGAQNPPRGPQPAGVAFGKRGSGLPRQKPNVTTFGKRKD